jgi:fumarate reductase flavoprotein subunit
MARHLIVVGAGIAGMAAAIFAAKEGARVSVLEKTNQLAGMLWHSSANFSAAGSKRQRAKGVEDSPERHYADIWRLGHGRSDPALLRLAIEHAREGVDWLTEIGVPWTDDSPRLIFSHETYSVPRTLFPVGYPGEPGNGLGRSVAEVLIAEYNRWSPARGVTTHFRATVTELLQDEAGAVRGVRYQQQGETRELLGDVTILATGGYGGSREMLRRYHPQWEDLALICLPHATGDGLALADRAGGTLTNLDVALLFPGAIRDPRAPHHAIFEIYGPSVRPGAQSGDIWVNRRAERFMREDEPSPERREHAVMAQPNAEMTLVFDEPLRRGLTEPIARRMQQEIEPRVPPVLVSAGSLAELAVKLDLPPEALCRTVARYNGFVAAGHDDDFGRQTLPKAIDTPPFHALPTVGTILLTHGGVKVDGCLRVVRPDGTPIPNLFAIGEVIGGAQVMGATFASGQGAGAALTFGILVGRNTARGAW